MQAGSMDRYIEIQTPDFTTDAAGERIATWSTYANVWAAKRDVTAREKFAGDQDLAEETAVFRLWWLDGVNATMQIVHDGKVYGIEGVAEIGRREGLELTARAVALPQS